MTTGCAGWGSRERGRELDHGETYDVGYGSKRRTTNISRSLRNAIMTTNQKMSTLKIKIAKQSQMAKIIPVAYDA